jgi:hypothetical protein
VVWLRVKFHFFRYKELYTFCMITCNVRYFQGADHYVPVMKDHQVRREGFDGQEKTDLFYRKVLIATVAG